MRPPKSPLRRGGAQGGSGSNPPSWIPNRGVQCEPVQKILRLTLLRSDGVVRLGCRVITAPYVVFTVRGRDEGSPRRGRTQPLRRGYGVGGPEKKPPVTHRDGVGGLLNNHRACRDCRDCWMDLEVDSRSALLVFPVLQTTSEIFFFADQNTAAVAPARCIGWKIGPRADTCCSFGLELRLCERAC